MSGVSIAIIALVLAVGASSFAWAGPAAIIAFPLSLLVVGGFLAVDLGRRRKESQSMQGFRDEAKADDVEFSSRDKETLASD